MRQAPATQQDSDARRRAARRTALAVGVLALAVYVGFMLLGTLGK